MTSIRTCPNNALAPSGKSHRRIQSLRTSALPVAAERECSGLYTQLLSCVDGQKFGASSTQQQRDQVLQVVEQLKFAQQTAAAAAASSAVQPAPTEGWLDASWRLLWTTESAVHKLVQGQLLGTPVKDIQQHIDLKEKRVTNSIAFGLLGLELQAAGPLTVLSSTRIYYSFDKLLLGLLGVKLVLPLFIKGGGWTDCVVVQQDVRVMVNSRRDTLVLQRMC